MLTRSSAALTAMLFTAVCMTAETIPNPTKRPGAGPLFQIASGEKWGFMDRTGRIVIPPLFAQEHDFFHGLAAVDLSEEKWGYIDESGKVAIEARFDEVGDFLGELAPVRIGRRWGYIDLTGRFVVEPQFQGAGEFHEGLARILVWSEAVCFFGRSAGQRFTSDDAPLSTFRDPLDGTGESQACFPEGSRFGFVDEAGVTVIPPRFFVAGDFAEGLAQVRVEEAADSKYGYIDSTGNMVIPARFGGAGSFSEGLAAVETSGRIVGDHVEDIAWGFIDKTGTLKIPAQYKFADAFSDSLARVSVRLGGGFGYIDHDGTMVIEPRYTSAWNFSEGFAAVCGERCVYIDHSGSPVLTEFRAWWPFSDGLTVVDSGESQVYIDRQGRVIAPYR